MPNTQTSPRTREGFPLVTCRRCGGSGHYSYNQIDGSKCYGCVGTGWNIAPRARKAWEAYQAAKREAFKPTLSRVAVGDMIRPSQSKDEWREVAAIRTEDEACGWQIINGERIPTSFYITITYVDGATERRGGNQLVSRKAVVDPAPFLATIRNL